VEENLKRSSRSYHIQRDVLGFGIGKELKISLITHFSSKKSLITHSALPKIKPQKQVEPFCRLILARPLKE